MDNKKLLWLIKCSSECLLPGNTRFLYPPFGRIQNRSEQNGRRRLFFEDGGKNEYSRVGKSIRHFIRCGKKESLQWQNTHRHNSLADGTCIRYIPGNSASSHSSKRCPHRKENAYLHRRQQTISFPLVFFPRTNHTERILVRLSYHFSRTFSFQYNLQFYFILLVRSHPLWRPDCIGCYIHSQFLYFLCRIYKTIPRHRPFRKMADSLFPHFLDSLFPPLCIFFGMRLFSSLYHYHCFWPRQ